MWIRVALVAAGLVGVAVVVLVGFTLSFRHKFRPVQDVVRRFNRGFSNPRQLRQSGQPGSWASVVQHTGRRSGRVYRTPAVAVPVDDGFLFALPYGPGADWVRNVLARGEADLLHEGRTLRVGQPRLVPATEADPHFEPRERRMHRIFGVRDFLLVRAEPQPS